VLIEIALVSAAAALGALVATRRRGGPAATPEAPPPEAPSAPDPGGLVRLGEVLAAGGEERWLTGAVRGVEGREEAIAVFLATDAPFGRAVAVHAEEPDLLWLETAPLPDGVAPRGPLPTTLEVDRTIFESASLRPVRFAVEGEFERRIAGDAGERFEPFDAGDGDFGLYRAGVRDVLLIVRGPSGGPWVWRGRTVARSEIERWGKGAS